MSLLVVDASVVIAALSTIGGSEGVWAEGLIASATPAAPELVYVEVASALRRAVLAKQISDEMASLAYDDLLLMPLVLYPFAPHGERVWELRRNVRSYDALYVAMAERLDAPLATLDARLARASGPRCEFVTPPKGKKGR